MIDFFDESRLTEFVRTARMEELADVHWVEIFAGKPSRSDSDGENVSITSLQLIDTVLDSITDLPRLNAVAELFITNFEYSLSGSPYDYIDELGERKSYAGTEFGKFVCTHIKGKVKHRQRISQVKMKYLENKVEKREKEEKKPDTDIEEEEKAYLPTEFQNKRAFALLKNLRDVGWLDDVFHPTRIGKGQQAVVCYLICNELGIKNCWKVSSELTGDNCDTMRTNFKDYRSKHKNDFMRLEKEFSKIIKNFHKEMRNS